ANRGPKRPISLTQKEVDVARTAAAERDIARERQIRLPVRVEVAHSDGGKVQTSWKRWPEIEGAVAPPEKDQGLAILEPARIGHDQVRLAVRVEVAKGDRYG